MIAVYARWTIAGLLMSHHVALVPARRAAQHLLGGLTPTYFLAHVRAEPYRDPVSDIPNPHSILTFVPAKDFEISTRFYRAMGFEVNDDEDLRFVQLGNFGFLLQDFYVKKWGDNFMMAMHVDDAQWWVDRHSSVAAEYAGTWNSPPELQDWGPLLAHFTAPTGVLWHITQTPTG